MYRRILIGGVTAAAIVGAGGTALALSGSDDAMSGNPVASSEQAQMGKGMGLGMKAGRGKLLRRLEHAQIVTKGDSGPVTHNLINGTVTAVSATSITVEAADHESQTFTITSDTKVRVRSAGNGKQGTIADVAKGDHVLVAGTGTSKVTAKHVFDIKE
jgi:hypothetical protein